MLPDSMGAEGAGLQACHVAGNYVIERGAEAAVVVVFERDEAEGLQDSVGRFLRWAQNFGHAVYRSGLGLKCDFDEDSLTQRLREAKQASGGRDGLESGFGAASVFKTDGSEDGISKLDAGSATGRVRLGELGHKLKGIMAPTCIDWKVTEGPRPDSALVA